MLPTGAYTEDNRAVHCLRAQAVAILHRVLVEVLGVELHTCGGAWRACIHMQATYEHSRGGKLRIHEMINNLIVL